MNEETKAKFAAIIAAQQAKINKAVAPKAKEEKQETPQPINNSPLDEYREANTPKGTPELKEGEKSKMQSFTILWHEGTGEFDGKTFTTWKDANKAMGKIYRSHGDSLGYTKVKINVKWGNGAEIIDRCDCGNSGGDFNANRYTIGKYLEQLNSVMYGSNLQKGDRKYLSFEDTEQTQPAAEPEPVREQQSIPEPETPELSTLTFADLMQSGTDTTEQPKFCYPAVFQPLPTKQARPAATAEKTNAVQLVDYSEKSFAIVGETYPIRAKLAQLGGSFNHRLRCGAGWIFSKTKMDAVKKALSI